MPARLHVFFAVTDWETELQVFRTAAELDAHVLSWKGRMLSGRLCASEDLEAAWERIQSGPEPVRADYHTRCADIDWLALSREESASHRPSSTAGPGIDQAATSCPA